MKSALYLILAVSLLASCAGNGTDEPASENEVSFQLDDGKEAEQALYKELGVSVIKEYLRIFPDTALSDTSFLIHYHKIDEQGRKVRSAEYRIDGQLISSSVNQFDESGKRIAFSSVNSKGEPRGRSEISYNNADYPIQIKSYDPADNHVMTIDFEYLPKERQVIQHIKDNTGTEKSTLIFDVGENDRFSQCLVRRQGKEFIQYFSYSPEKQLTQDLLKEGENVIARTKYEYMDNGLRQFKWLIGVGDTLEGIVEYEYEFYENQ